MFTIFRILGNNEKWKCLPLLLAENKAKHFHGSSILVWVVCLVVSAVKENGGVRGPFWIESSKEVT